MLSDCVSKDLLQTLLTCSALLQDQVLAESRENLSTASHIHAEEDPAAELVGPTPYACSVSVGQSATLLAL